VFISLEAICAYLVIPKIRETKSRPTKLLFYVGFVGSFVVGSYPHSARMLSLTPAMANHAHDSSLRFSSRYLLAARPLHVLHHQVVGGHLAQPHLSLCGLAPWLLAHLHGDPLLLRFPLLLLPPRGDARPKSVLLHQGIPAHPPLRSATGQDSNCLIAFSRIINIIFTPPSDNNANPFYPHSQKVCRLAFWLKKIVKIQFKNKKTSTVAKKGKHQHGGWGRQQRVRSL
jgi:hypothetical protein